jgi:hypothetical protein
LLDKAVEEKKLIDPRSKLHIILLYFHILLMLIMFTYLAKNGYSRERDGAKKYRKTLETFSKTELQAAMGIPEVKGI